MRAWSSVSRCKASCSRVSSRQILNRSRRVHSLCCCPALRDCASCITFQAELRASEQNEESTIARADCTASCSCTQPCGSMTALFFQQCSTPSCSLAGVPPRISLEKVGSTLNLGLLHGIWGARPIRNARFLTREIS